MWAGATAGGGRHVDSEQVVCRARCRLGKVYPAPEDTGRWHALARLALRDDLYASLRAITLDGLREAAPGTPVDAAIAQWEKANASRLVRARAALHGERAASY